MQNSIKHLRMYVSLLFETVIFRYPGQVFCHDLQNQRSNDIAIHHKNYLWQTPSEPCGRGQNIDQGFKYIQQTSRSIRPEHPERKRQQTNNTAAIPPCQTWWYGRTLAMPSECPSISSLSKFIIGINLYKEWRWKGTIRPRGNRTSTSLTCYVVVR